MSPSGLVKAQPFPLGLPGGNWGPGALPATRSGTATGSGGVRGSSRFPPVLHGGGTGHARAAHTRGNGPPASSTVASSRKLPARLAQASRLGTRGRQSVGCEGTSPLPPPTRSSASLACRSGARALAPGHSRRAARSASPWTSFGGLHGARPPHTPPRPRSSPVGPPGACQGHPGRWATLLSRTASTRVSAGSQSPSRALGDRLATAGEVGPMRVPLCLSATLTGAFTCPRRGGDHAAPGGGSSRCPSRRSLG